LNKNKRKVGITELVLRDGQQSLIATRMRLDDMLEVANKMDQVGYWSVEMWGGATYDSCLRYLNEDPWRRLRELKKIFKKTKLQMLIRGKNLVGYKPYSDEIVKAFVEKASSNGIDVFRTFDALNDFSNIELSIKEVKKNGKHAQGAMAYTVSPVHSMNSWLDLAKQIEDAGADSVAIKDMAGLLKPNAAFELVSNLKENISVPIHMQTHATTGFSTATNMKAIEAGIDNIDTSISSMSMTYGHTATETIVSMFDDTNLFSDIDKNLFPELSTHFKKIRKKYELFEGSLKGVDASMLINQVPGGMLSNLESQLREMDADDKFEDVLNEIPRVRQDLGFVPLVTPSSQIVGAQALFNVLDNERYKHLNIETVNLILGKYGKVPGKINEFLTDLAKKLKQDDEVQEDLDSAKSNLKTFCKENKIKDFSQRLENVLSYIFFPNIVEDFFLKKGSRKDTNLEQLQEEIGFVIQE
jgi:oxaloacetate decarboxylase alpha subunit|tara:strand:+ start:1938 stop:3347 length:1410 start_codon:yes stop_codon:yes gene_type:complete